MLTECKHPLALECGEFTGKSGKALSGVGLSPSVSALIDFAATLQLGLPDDPKRSLAALCLAVPERLPISSEAHREMESLVGYFRLELPSKPRKQLIVEVTLAVLRAVAGRTP